MYIYEKSVFELFMNYIMEITTLILKKWFHLDLSLLNFINKWNFLWQLEYSPKYSHWFNKILIVKFTLDVMSHGRMY